MKHSGLIQAIVALLRAYVHDYPVNHRDEGMEFVVTLFLGTSIATHESGFGALKRFAWDVSELSSLIGFLGFKEARPSVPNHEVNG